MMVNQGNSLPIAIMIVISVFVSILRANGKSRMATRPESMGIYADLAKKRAEKYDVELEGRVRAWIEGVLGRKLDGPTFRESLMDGVAVCDLINNLKPGTIPKIHRSAHVMFRRENFGFFQRACLKLGCKDNETAVFEDVYEDRNMGQFLINILALARVTQNEPGYNGPILADAAKKASVAPVVHHEPGQGKFLGTFMDAQNAEIGAVKEASRSREHGVIHQMGDATQSTGPKGYLGTFQEEAAAQAGKAKEAARHTEHGIIHNAGDAVQASSPKGYLGTRQEEAAAQAERAKEAARHTEHGIIHTAGDAVQTSSPKGYLGTFQEEAAAQAERAKEAARYREHGIIRNSEEHLFHGEKDPKPSPPPQPAPAKGGYVPSYQEMALMTAQKAKEAGRYREHGIVMDPNENIHHGEKDAKPAEGTPPVGYIPTYVDAAREEAGRAMEAGRYKEHGILMNPDDNIHHGIKSDDVNDCDPNAADANGEDADSS